MSFLTISAAKSPLIDQWTISTREMVSDFNQGGAGSQFLNSNFNFNAFKMVMKTVVKLDGQIRKPIMNNFMHL